MDDVGRRSIPQRVRFEVFKRDKFTCQYCGATAPTVVLNCDHIHPVSGGGTNDLLNLITSCRPCNGGKGAIPLSDDGAAEKQRRTLEELEDRRQQIEMMLNWRDDMLSHRDDVVQQISGRVQKRIGWFLSEHGKASIARLLKRYSASEVIFSLDECLDTYLTYFDGKPTVESIERALSSVPKMLITIRQEKERPHLRRLLYIQGIIRNRIKARECDRLDYLEHLVACGVDIDDIEMRARRLTDLTALEAHYDAYLKNIGNPF